jgi:hypothetical protein
MKTLMLSLVSLLLASSCDNPQRNRLATNLNTGNNLGTGTTAGSNPWGNTGTTTGSTTGGTSTTTKPPGFENCDISAKYFAAGINYMGICQSTMDETSVAINSTVSDTLRTCLIPTYKDTSGSSTYLGQPQCYLPQAGAVTTGSIYKTRTGYTTNPINGVMVMKERSLTAYFTCMDAYTSYKSTACPYGPTTNASCDAYARQLMTQKCNDFKAAHAYIDIRLK